MISMGMTTTAWKRTGTKHRILERQDEHGSIGTAILVQQQWRSLARALVIPALPEVICASLSYD
eukprot:CAMPEP_0171649082 /NCGR_PEP_ID=MMETSP0990-20121206/36553_1 /TAXON_ID=483369 /ORGANISM="non described non described, Strain CCMP2098" /LENGTH=63 /DNA_ID=CAMNT_0012226855 /DNA_START=33 /DNA_END=224 /DNA_ORIENTATION=-